MIDIVNVPQSLNNFILVTKTDRLDVCDKVIDYWKTSNQKVPGQIYGVKGLLVDPEYKDSIDVPAGCPERPLSEITNEYYNSILAPAIDLYIKYFNECNIGDSWGWRESASIQYYKPNGGFKEWHCERTSCEPISVKRKLVFMTYLCDVDDVEEYQGGTEWLYQGFKAKARKGHTVIWPADWTHTHRGIISPNKEKYIITGWLSFYQDKFKSKNE